MVLCMRICNYSRNSMSMEFEILKHNIMSLLRTCVLSVQLIVYLLTFRPFGSVIYDVTQKSLPALRQVLH